ncbi:hypothetical protein UlMin_016641 [Ulmus minor]
MAAGVSSTEAQVSIAASSMFPGFRFSPTDEELISYYLKNKLEGSEKSVGVVPEIEIWMYEPWDLPAKSVIRSENEWFFFSPRGRKYPNGSQSRRATEQGYWKATGKERNVKSGSNLIGTKRTLVFHLGRAPKGERTEWIMHEYSMLDKSQDSMVVCRLRKNGDFHLNNSRNRASTSLGQPSTMLNSNCAVSAVGTDQGEKAVECCSKKCSTSYDSYSAEQIDSASESNQKLTPEVTQPECSGHQKDYDDDEDFYADILNDDIVKLDESSMADLEMNQFTPTKPVAEQKSEYPAEAQALPFQGTANRRIKLGKQGGSVRKKPSMTSKGIEYFVGKIKSPRSEESSKCSKNTIWSARITVNGPLMIVFFLLTLMALFVLGGSWVGKIILENSLSHGF